MKHSGLTNFFKYFLTFLAIVNLILLFGFRYEIPEEIKNRFFDNKAEETPLYSPQEEQDAVNLSFDSEVLYYDGSQSLDLLDGISITDKDGEPLELTAYSTIRNTDDQNTKIVTYTVKDEENNEAYAERKLVLHNYYGPALTIGQPYPEIFDIELNHILETFQSAEVLSANDGYGKNITDSIECSYKIEDDKAREVKITFKVTNHFHDTVSETIKVPISRTKPLIVLTDSSVTIEKDEAFNALEYVASATNEEGQNLTSRIKTTGEVDTGKAGTYSISYTLTDSDLEQADTVKLSVTVKE